MNIHYSMSRLVAAPAALLLGLGCLTSHSDVTLINAGTPSAQIYVLAPLNPPDLSASERRALSHQDREAREDAELLAASVNDLVYHLQQMAGAAPQIVEVPRDAKPAIQKPAILIGALATQKGATPGHQTVMRESYRLIVRDGLVLIGGESALGVSHGIYALLGKLGCDWIMPGPEGEIIPKRQTVIVPEFDEARKPTFEIRAQWYSGGRNIIIGDEYPQLEQWKRRHGQTPRAHVSRHPDFLVGGHFWHSVIGAYKKTRLAEDPTMYALVRKPDGTYARGHAQLDPMHPGTVDMCADFIRNMFEKNGWPKDKATTLSVGPNDGGGYSESAEVLAAGGGRFDPITGDRDQTDVMILFANRLIEMLEPEFPNLKLGFYIYSVHADYPMRYTPHAKFVAHFADITYSRFHALTDPRSPTRNYYRNILEQWADLYDRQGNPMWFYGYNWNLAENLMPYSKMKIWGEDLPYYHAMGVRGHNNEQDKAWSVLGPHNYLMAKMGWNIDLDWRNELKRYCRLSFGKGAPFVERYYLNLIERQETQGMEAGCYFAIAQIFDQSFVADSKKLFKKAMAAAETAEEKKRVDYFSQPVEALRIYLDYVEATRDFEFSRALELYDEMVAHWESYLNKNSNLVSRYGRRYIDWLFKPFAEQGKMYSTGEYAIVHRLPEELPTRLDPGVSGHLMGYQLPEVNDRLLVKTHTYTSTWMDQGLGAYRRGAVWYRDRFKLGRNAKGKPIGLFIGAVEDEVHVWCNGKYVGKGRGFIAPFQFDLTDFVKREGENTIALQIIRNSYLNEIGMGGLLYPSFVFAGPRLDNPAPLVEPLRRVLPGGAEGELEK